VGRPQGPRGAGGRSLLYGPVLVDSFFQPGAWIMLDFAVQVAPINSKIISASIYCWRTTFLQVPRLSVDQLSIYVTFQVFDRRGNLCRTHVTRYKIALIFRSCPISCMHPLLVKRSKYSQHLTETSCILTILCSLPDEVVTW
jgi:hypothetical protein